MAEVKEPEICWHDESEKELLRQISAGASPPFVPSKAADGGTAGSQRRVPNTLTSSAYSGPTIEDIERALSTIVPDVRATSRRYRAPVPEKGIGKSDTKYAVMIKSCGGGVAEDGYKWRKYGQKTIKNNPNPRSYYRCTNPRCSAKRQVERSKDDPNMLTITYEGLHLHYPHFHVLRRRPQDHTAPKLQVLKKPKLQAEVQLHTDYKSQSIIIQGELREEEVVAVTSGDSSPGSPDRGLEEEASLNPGVDAVQYQEGLLQDVVPLLVREPCATGSAVSSCHPYHFFQTPRPSYYSASISPPTNPSDIDLGLHFRHSLNLKQSKDG
ncbi:hypothetical protein OPV22_027346 [Ensete ventricosum]|uniref:WRKY domain-containing protein n=1 Tax=Ensete ventricosum TaxID=4639 RepID=A0AAV8Q0B0_ENSVE|nr:hypothetical protein OPV22_027346 [Ensete ventricosum]